MVMPNFKEDGEMDSYPLLGRSNTESIWQMEIMRLIGVSRLWNIKTSNVRD